MEQHEIKLPLATQATTNEKTRFVDGLAKQVELFGEEHGEAADRWPCSSPEHQPDGWQITALVITIPETA